MKKILISSCLLGEKVRYDGKGNFVESDIIAQWQKDNSIVPVCPEVSGGLSIPRVPSEIRREGLLDIKIKVVRKGDFLDITEYFNNGANYALDLVKKYNIKVAILKENSPSCGVNQVYDGSFSGTKIAGSGITTEVLKKNGVKVFSEYEIEEAYKYMQSLGDCKSVKPKKIKNPKK